MRVYCRECGSVAVITKTQRLSLDAADLYCSCKQCNHRFVWSAGFKHSLTESVQEKSDVICLLFNGLPDNKKRDLLHTLQKDGV